MLSFERKQAVFESFPELTKTKISNGRINFEYRASRKPGKVLCRELYRSGNGYVCGRYMKDVGCEIDERGWINIKEFSKEQLQEVIQKAIDSMSKP